MYQPGTDSTYDGAQACAESRSSSAEPLGHFIVYCAICLVNGKKYIGYTGQGLRARKEKHEFAARQRDPKDKSYFHKALLRHGFHEFCWKEIDSTDSETEAHKKESEAIWKYKTLFPDGYNLNDAPPGPSRGSQKKFSF